MLNSLTWQRIGECTHPTEVRESFADDAVAWTEPTDDNGGYIARRLPISVPSLRANPDKPQPKVGIGLLSWSTGGRYLATRNDNMPRVLWVWDGTTLLLHSVLLQIGAIRMAVWHPTQQLLAICTSSSKVFMWSPRGCRTAPLPTAHELEISQLAWNAQGDALLLLDADRFCVCFVSLPSEPSEEEHGPSSTVLPLTEEEQNALRRALDAGSIEVA